MGVGAREALALEPLELGEGAVELGGDGSLVAEKGLEVVAGGDRSGALDIGVDAALDVLGWDGTLFLMATEEIGIAADDATETPVVHSDLLDQELFNGTDRLDVVDECGEMSGEFVGVFGGSDDLTGEDAVFKGVLGGGLLAGGSAGTGGELGIAAIGGDLGGGGHVEILSVCG